MSSEHRPLTTEEFHLVAHLLAVSVSPLWSRLVLRVLNATGPGQGAKAAAVLWRVLPAEELEWLEAVYDRLQPPEGWRRV